MNLEMNMEMSHRMDQRQTLEQKLEARMEQQTKLEMVLAQYLLREDLITGLIRWADENMSWAEFDKSGFHFFYALVPYKLAKPIADIAGPGFAHCLYNPFEERGRGEWTLFVVPDMVPKEFVDFVALHERGEELSSGNHYFASQLEFAYVGKRKKIRKYLDWIDKTYPSKFIDLTQEVIFPILPQEVLDIRSERGKRKKTELNRAKELIDKHPLPTPLLKIIDRYYEVNKSVMDKLRTMMGRTQYRISTHYSINAYDGPEEAARIANEEIIHTMSRIQPAEARVISKVQARDFLGILAKTISYDTMRFANRALTMPTDFDVLYQHALDGRDVVNVLYRAEDKHVKEDRKTDQEEVSAFKLAVNH